MDVEILSRIQFAFTVAFHYLYPPLSIGLGWIMVVAEGLYLKTKDPVYGRISLFFVRLFAIIFGLGVATGIVMEFEFGTNWATYSRFVGDIFGSALAAEGIFAFALESGFLGILLFGWNRVSPRVHFISTFMVALGSTFSAIWIVVANSWMHTPAGYHLVTEQGRTRAEITDFWAMVFNPSSMDRLVHVLLGAILAGAFLVISVAAWYRLKGVHREASRKMMGLGLSFAAVAILAQWLSGHRSAELVAEYQPAKLAAMEGHFETGPADLYAVGWVDAERQKIYGLGLPGGLSFLLHWNFDGHVAGLNAFAPEDQPRAVNAIFQFYHAMVGSAGLMTVLAFVGLWAHFKGKWDDAPWWNRILIFSVFLPQIANQAGWFAAEMGRQPWVVYGLLRTKDALSPTVGAAEVLFSLILFTLVYLLLFGLFIYLLNKKIKKGPADEGHLIDHRPKQASWAPKNPQS
jgi:cytochrome d ubiquinol oxidase subunit I